MTNEEDFQQSQNAETIPYQLNDMGAALVIDNEDDTKAVIPATALEAALTAVLMGFAVFPCDPETKRPLIKDWSNQATRDYDMLTHWWTQNPNAMVGAVTGKPSGFCCIDIDVKDGVDAYAKWGALEAQHGKLHPEWIVGTPSGGLHLFFKMPADTDVTNSAGKLGVGIDVRGTGGYVIFFGSTRADGKQYRLLDGGLN